MVVTQRLAVDNGFSDVLRMEAGGMKVVVVVGFQYNIVSCGHCKPSLWC